MTLKKWYEAVSNVHGREIPPPASPLNPWPWVIWPWEKVHVDFSEKNGKMFLAVADSHSKWLEVLIMNSRKHGDRAAKTVCCVRTAWICRFRQRTPVHFGGVWYILEVKRCCVRPTIRHQMVWQKEDMCRHSKTCWPRQTFEFPCNIGFLTFCFNTETRHTASQAVLLLNYFWRGLPEQDQPCWRKALQRKMHQSVTCLFDDQAGLVIFAALIRTLPGITWH